MKKVYIVGSNGYIGRKLCVALAGEYAVVGIDLHAEKPLDLIRAEDFRYDLFDAESIIVFTAAISSPDRCSEEYDLAYRINVTGTSLFIQEALRRGSRVLFFSSDAVFGFHNGIADEDTETKEDTRYGTMKKKVEDQFGNSPLFKVLRLSYVFSREDRYTSYLLDCVRNDRTAVVYHPFYRNVITLGEVIYVVRWMIKNWDSYEPRFLNVCGRDLVSRVRIADEIMRCTGLPLRYEIVRPAEMFYQNRPAILEMDSKYIDGIIDRSMSFGKMVESLFAVKGELYP